MARTTSLVIIVTDRMSQVLIDDEPLHQGLLLIVAHFLVTLQPSRDLPKLSPCLPRFLVTEAFKAGVQASIHPSWIVTWWNKAEVCVDEVNQKPFDLLIKLWWKEFHSSQSGWLLGIVDLSPVHLCKLSGHHHQSRT